MAADDNGLRSIRALSRAAQLLLQVLSTGSLDPESIARELVVSVAELQRYLSGSAPIPLDRQLCLALFVIKNVPTLAREARGLHGQVCAAIAYEAHETETHATAPPGVWFR